LRGFSSSEEWSSLYWREVAVFIVVECGR
jgi:hypothetical protein